MVMLVNTSNLSRLGSIAAFLMASRRNTASSAMVQHFLSGIATVVGLAVTLGLCMGALLIAGLYGTYRGLVLGGLDTDIALICVFVIMGFIIALLCIVLRDKVRALKDAPAAIMHSEAPIIGDVRQTVTAFVDGLRGRSSTPRF